MDEWSEKGNGLAQGVSKTFIQLKEKNILSILDHKFTISNYIPVIGAIISEYSEFYPISIRYLHPDTVI